MRTGEGPTGEFTRPPNPGRPDQQIARAGDHRKGRGRARGRSHSDPRCAEAEIAIVTRASMGKAVSRLKPAHAPRMPEIAGVRLATAAAGIRYAGRTDVLLVALDRPTSVAGVFTRSKCPSAPVEWCRGRIGGGRARALVVNSGNANAFTGKTGRAATRITAELAAKAVRSRHAQPFLASTAL